MEHALCNFPEPKVMYFNGVLVQKSKSPQFIVMYDKVSQLRGMIAAHV